MGSLPGSRIHRPEKKHDRGSRPRPSPGPTSGPCAVRRDPRVDGSAMGSSPAAYQGDRSWGWGEASRLRGLLVGEACCLRGVLPMMGGTGASRPGANQAAVTVHGGIDGGPRPLPRQTLSVRSPPLFPPGRGETQGPMFRPPSGNRSSPPQGETERVFFPGGCRSSSRERQRESSDAEILRFSHRLNAPQFAAEHRAPAGLRPNPWPPSFRNARTQESQSRRRPMIRGPRPGRSRCWSEALIAGEPTGASAGWCGVPPHPTGLDPFSAGQNGTPSA